MLFNKTFISLETASISVSTSVLVFQYVPRWHWRNPKEEFFYLDLDLWVGKNSWHILVKFIKKQPWSEKGLHINCSTLKYILQTSCNGTRCNNTKVAIKSSSKCSMVTESSSPKKNSDTSSNLPAGKDRWLRHSHYIILVNIMAPQKKIPTFFWGAMAIATDPFTTGGN